MAAASLACGLIPLLPATVAAIILGIGAQRRIRRTGERGAALATAGLTLSLLWLVLTVLVFLVFPNRCARCKRPSAGAVVALVECSLLAAVSPHRPLRALSRFFELYRSSWNPVTKSNRRPSLTMQTDTV